MRAKLTRAMLWDDKKSLDEILKVFPGEFLYGMYLDSIVRAHPMGNFQLDALKVLNEVFYMCTRVVYEADIDADTGRYMREIKADMGSANAAKQVISLMDMLLKAQGDKSNPVVRFSGKLAVNHVTRDDFLNLFTAGLFSKETKEFYLEPSPCKPGDLEGMVIDWEKVTAGYNIFAVHEVVKLWKKLEDRKVVLDIIQDAFNHRQIKLFKVKDEVSEENFQKWQKELDDEIKRINTPKPLNITQEELSKLIEQALAHERLIKEEKIKELESELEKCKSELNNTRDEKNKETAFSLSMIVDHCKKKPDYSNVDQIESMLYKFLRNGTDKDSEIVDSIAAYFNAREKCNTYIKEQNNFSDVKNFKPQINNQTLDMSIPKIEQQNDKLLAK